MNVKVITTRVPLRSKRLQVGDDVCKGGHGSGVSIPEEVCTEEYYWLSVVPGFRGWYGEWTQPPDYSYLMEGLLVEVDMG